ncbi:MAG TPA: P1 family peptidase [Pseudohaliea sp.]|nr:P1 family peptidase [Pseudohaliea sp.]
MRRSARFLPLLPLLALAVTLAGEAAPRARALGVPFGGEPGPLNAITDVAGVAVGHETIIRDLDDGRAVRTGVTAILPRGADTLAQPVLAGLFSLNGNGELTGSHWIREAGVLSGPVLLTNTHSVGAVHDGAIRWRVAQPGADPDGYWWSLPVVAETWDGYLNDINGLHVTAAHAASAIEAAAPGPVAEGNVGGGTGMICHEFKGGIGTASRVVSAAGRAYTVGVLVQANYGRRDTLTIAGVPVGRHLREGQVYSEAAPLEETGSIIVTIATDAPLLPRHLERLARRAALGLARVGSYAGNGSGDIMLAFSTAAYAAPGDPERWQLQSLAPAAQTPLFLATVQATEEAIVNALVAAEDMQGNGGHRVQALDHDALRALLRRYNRLPDVPPARKDAP